MCDPNENNIISLDFSTVSDQSNWQTDSTNPLQTTGGKLVLNPSANDSVFERILGTMDPGNNRVKIKSNITATKTTIGDADTEIIFELFAGAEKIDDLCVPISNMEDGEQYAHFVDVNFTAMSNTPLILKIKIPEGWQNTIELSDLVVDDFNYCIDQVRTYFVIDGLLEDSLTAMSSGIELKEWKVDGVETLTAAYFSENNSIGGNPVTQWKFAKADLNGSNRVQDNVTPNSFNPFSDEFGLEYDNVASFYGGKPTGTISGSNYGTGILEVGFEKPAILNKGLESKKGAFFIDIDYTKDLKVVFDVLSNQNSSNVFTGPSYYRQYTLQWDSKRCLETFTYVDVLTGNVVDEATNGFLTGVSTIDVLSTIVQCDESFSPSGQSGNFTYDLDFGSDTGIVGIEYNAYSVPDRFLIEYDGVVHDTGFVGASSYDSQLIAAGVDPADINTGSPSTGSGSLTFSKPNATPTKATVTVLAPLGSTGWNVKGVCAGGNEIPLVDITANDTILEVGQEITVSLLSASDPDGSIASWVITYGDGVSESGTGNPPSTFTHTYTATGSRTITLTVTDNEGATGNDKIFLTVNNATSSAAIQCITECADPQNTNNGSTCWEVEIDAPLNAGYRLDVRRFSLEDGVTFAALGDCPCTINADRHETVTAFNSPFNSNVWPNKTFSFGIKHNSLGYGNSGSWRVRVLNPSGDIIDEKTFERIG